jgi:hypothetical protein
VKSSKLNTLKRQFAADFYAALVSGLSKLVKVPVMQPGELAQEAREVPEMKFHTCSDGRTKIAAGDGKCKHCRAHAPRWANRAEMVEAIRQSRDIHLTWVDADEVRRVVIGKNTEDNRKRAAAVQQMVKTEAVDELVATFGAGVTASLLCAKKLVFELVRR